ncbi:MAG: hypothetical protein Q9190_007153 [Brigantiaea leucoxantha]
MKEKEQGYAVLKGVTPDTFNRFLQWVYHGFYSAPHPKMVDASSPLSPDTLAIKEANEVRIGGSVDVPASEAIEADIGKPVEPDFDWSDFGSKTKNKKARKNEDCCCSQFSSSSRQSLRQAFISRSYEALRSAVPIPLARKNENENEDYADVFLSHARLYVFANKYLIYDLKTLALENLHETLKFFEFYSYRTGDIVSLIRYVYGNTQIPDDGKIEPIRSLLAEYVGLEMDILMKDSAFRDLMIEDEILDTAQRQSLLDDYMAAVMKRI